MSEKNSFQSVLEALLNESQTFPARYLARFSDLEPAQLEALAEIWPRVPLARKVALLEDLQDLAEDDTLVSFEAFARARLKDPEPSVRAGALRLLVECEDTHLVPDLLDLLNADDEPEVRAAAAVVLGQFIYLGELEKIPAATLREIEDHLLTATRDAYPLVRRRSLEALGASSRPELPALIEAAYHQEDPDWIVSALFAMGRSGDLRWSKQILSKLNHPNQAIRTEAVQAAGELGLTAARSALLDQLEDEEDLLVRHEIIWALSQIGGEGVRERLEELADAADAEEDDEEAEFLEEALSNLAFTEDKSLFDMFDFETEDDL
ncbi:MAG: HEAT repeat domain-containing protein [Anaerolineales bacterium]